MPGMYSSGAVYNHYLHNLMDVPTSELEVVLDGWTRKSWWAKILAHCNPLTDWEMKLSAGRDLIAAREQPISKIGIRVNRKIFSWCAERDKSVSV